MKIRKIACMLMMLILSMAFAMIVSASEGEKRSLSEMSEEECYETLIEQGLVVPICFEEYSNLKSWVKSIVDDVIENPNRISWYNFTVSQDFAMEIREIVLEIENIEINYYNETQPVSLYALTRLRTTPIYSTVLVDHWEQMYNGYNCYTYALNKNSHGSQNPGYKSGISINVTQYPTMTVSRMAAIVSYDLQAMGGKSILYSTSFPDSARLGGNYRIIALRKCDVDYHFMYFTGVNSWKWNHKPSSAVPMRYNYSSLYEGKWTDEGLYQFGFKEGNIEYDSEIIYISYIP